MKESLPAKKVFKKMDFLIEPRRNEMSLQSMTDEQLNDIEDDEKNNKFVYIQQALHHINMQAPLYDQVNATIWLIKGDHFFFYCDRLRRKKEKMQALDANKLCRLKSM